MNSVCVGFNNEMKLASFISMSRIKVNIKDFTAQ